jgi:hypothetical protein
MTERAVKGQFPQEKGLRNIGFDLPRTEQNSHRDRKVVRRPLFFKIGGRQVYDYAAHGKGKTGVFYSGPRPFSRFPYGIVGEPDDKKVGQARSDIDFDFDEGTLQTNKGATDDLGQHIELNVNQMAAACQCVIPPSLKVINTHSLAIFHLIAISY